MRCHTARKRPGSRHTCPVEERAEVSSVVCNVRANVPARHGFALWQYLTFGSSRETTSGMYSFWHLDWSGGLTEFPGSESVSA